MYRTDSNLFQQVLRLAATTLAATLVLLATPAGPAAAEPVRSKQWYLNALRIPQAQQITKGEGITVAVIDSGVDNTNPDLKGQTVKGACFGAARFLEPTDDPLGHGTSMAGIIAARGGGPSHSIGIAPQAKIMPLCINADHVSADAAYKEVAPAIRYATDHGAQVINMSVGTTDLPLDKETAALKAAVRYALDHNVVLVAAAGNKPRATRVSAPANIPGVIAVTGTDRSGKLWSKSVQGKQAALAAPATDIIAPTSSNKDNKDGTQGGSTYDTGSGTSNSCAIVAGVAALVRAKYPKLDAANVINRLIRTADHKGPPGRNDKYGYGIVDPVRALTATVPHVDTNPLGEPAASSPSPANDTPAADPSTRAAAGTGGAGGGHGTLWTVLIVLAVVVLAVVVIVALVRRRSRRTSSGWPPSGGAGELPRT